MTDTRKPTPDAMREALEWIEQDDRQWVSNPLPGLGEILDRSETGNVKVRGIYGRKALAALRSAPRQSPHRATALAQRIRAYLDDAPPSGQDFETAGANAYCLLADALAVLSAPLLTRVSIEQAKKGLRDVINYLHPFDDKHRARAFSSSDSLIEKLVSALSPSATGAAELVGWLWHSQDNLEWKYSHGPKEPECWKIRQPVYTTPSVREDQEP